MKTMNDYCREKFGKKLYKLSLDGGFTCPNRDGTKGTGGCIFCSRSGSGDFAESGNDIKEQIERAKRRVEHKNKNGGYIAYFQSFTSTYAPIERLKKLFSEAINHPDIDVLSIGTRPDCLPEETIALLGELNKIKPVWVELGLQTSKKESIEYIRRCYENEVYEKAVKALHDKGIYVITHMIIGLPGESREDIKNTLFYILNNKSDGVKLQLLHILKDSDLYEEYKNGNIKTLTKEEYLDILKELLRLIPEEVAVHRLTGDGNKNTLVSPMWSANKKDVINSVNKLVQELGQEQKYIFREIKEDEIPIMFEMILSRMKWMDKVGIKQWNVTKYDEVYPIAYYEEKRQKGEVFVLEEKTNGDIVAAAVLKSEDDRWEGVPCYKRHSAFYLHNFAAKIGKKGVGAIFLSLAEEYAKEKGKEYFRLDSADDNKKLEKYYTEKGYIPVGECIDGLYTGILREKKLQEAQKSPSLTHGKKNMGKCP
ncbi:MAG: TIGR01212 family radical SAM protein [Clostridia bacterium]|nr:TIGR01212 family radical SAM protein [Clostridia bacterium]